jgi:hypothetical protein
LTKYELEILQKLSKDESITTDTTDTIYYEGFKQAILRLRGLGFIENRKEKSGLSDRMHAHTSEYYKRVNTF